jgi:hypothetical protein
MTGTIEPGEWVSIYGTNLASTTATWNGDFPVSLGGTGVTINGKQAYLDRPLTIAEGNQMAGFRREWTEVTLYINDAPDLEPVLTEILGHRYFIQINRGTGSLFQWRVIVGLQDRSVKGASRDNAQAGRGGFVGLRL